MNLNIVVNSVDNLEKFFIKSPLVFLKTVRIEDVIFDERAKYMCKYGCKNFNRKYSCPPYSISQHKRISESDFQWVLLFATSYKINEEYSRYKIRYFNIQKEYEIQRISNQIYNFISFNGYQNMVFSGGSCKRCRPCSCIEGIVCKKPLLKQISMEAIQIDCIKTLTYAGFDFQLTDSLTLNRCGCVFTNDESLSEVNLKKNDSAQKFKQASLNEIIDHFNLFIKTNPKIYENFKIIPIKSLRVSDPFCEKKCKYFGRNYSCPPYSKKMKLKLWNYAIIWKWKENRYKKYNYNQALKNVHKMANSLGHYFSISIRDCFCDECSSCTFSDSITNFCQNRKILSPSMQSQGIDPSNFGKGRYGIELI